MAAKPRIPLLGGYSMHTSLKSLTMPEHPGIRCAQHPGFEMKPLPGCRAKRVTGGVAFPVPNTFVCIE